VPAGPLLLDPLRAPSIWLSRAISAINPCEPDNQTKPINYLKP
jgi:hypothetical protein